MRAFLDANVLFAAAYSPAGRCAALLQFGADDDCEWVTSPHALEETRRNLTLKRPATLALLETALKHMIVTPEAQPAFVLWAEKLGLPGKDAPILAAAVQARARYLVTGDRKDFGPFFGQEIRGLLVLKPADMLDILLSR